MDKLELSRDKEYSLVLVKPDGYRRRLVGEIISRFERKGYRVVALRVLNATAEQLAEHYVEHRNKHFFPSLVEYMSDGPMVALILEGVRVIDGVRNVVGTTDPTTAAAGTIRGDFGCDWGTGRMENLVHASDSNASAAREIKVWFPNAQFN